VTGPVALPPLRPGRRITGMAAVLLPFDETGAVDWDALAAGVERTAAAGLVPAVNMDTGYGPALDTAARARVLAVTAAALAGAEPAPGWTFVAGAHVDDPSPEFSAGAHRAALAEVAAAGGVPILFPSAGLAGLADGAVADAHAAVAPAVDRLLAFELGRQFHPVGRIWSLATFAPEAFACRDRLWAAGDARALAVDDALQALGAVAFRPPVPAYRHDAALVWRQRGWAATARVHPDCPTRRDGEADLLEALVRRLDEVVGGTRSSGGRDDG
jgi:hypothetical protein